MMASTADLLSMCGCLELKGMTAKSQLSDLDGIREEEGERVVPLIAPLPREYLWLMHP